MTNDNITGLIALCRAGSCAIKLEGCTTGIVATVSAHRGDVQKSTSVWLDANDPTNPAKLQAAVERVQ